MKSQVGAVGVCWYLPAAASRNGASPDQRLRGHVSRIGLREVHAGAMHSSVGGSGSSSEQPSPEDMQRMRTLFSASENEAPVAVLTNAVLGRGPDAAVLLTSAVAYSTGTEFAVSLRVRPTTRRRSMPLHQLINGFGSDEIDARRAFLLGFSTPMVGER